LGLDIQELILGGEAARKVLRVHVTGVLITVELEHHHLLANVKEEYLVGDAQSNHQIGQMYARKEVNTDIVLVCQAKKR